MHSHPHPNSQTIDRFYAAFARLDPAPMAECYAPDARFDDEAFSLQSKEHIMAMWTMLIETTRAKGRSDWSLHASNISADAQKGQAHWQANYLFSKTGRKVCNEIDAVFEFNAQGLISRHTDSFDLWSWTRQALGAPGYLLGWSPYMRSKVRATAAENLRKYRASRG
jgi:ketosteroid isomerase-like protein